MSIKHVKKILTKSVIFVPLCVASIVAIYLYFFIKETYVVQYTILSQDYNIALSVMEKESFLEDVYKKVSRDVDVNNYSFDAFKKDVQIVGQSKTLMIDVSVKGNNKALAEKIGESIHYAIKNKLKINLTNSAFNIYILKEKKAIVSSKFVNAKDKYESLKRVSVIKADAESAIRALAQIQATLEMSQDKEEQNRNASQINISSLSGEIYSVDNRLSVMLVNVILDYYYWKYLNDNFEEEIKLKEKSQDWQLNGLAGDFKARAKSQDKLIVVLSTYFLILCLSIFIEATNVYYKKD